MLLCSDVYLIVGTTGFSGNTPAKNSRSSSDVVGSQLITYMKIENGDAMIGIHGHQKGSRI